MFTRTCAGMEGSDSIRVTAVLPGLVRTALINKSGDGTRQAAWVGMAEPFMTWQIMALSLAVCHPSACTAGMKSRSKK